MTAGVYLHIPFCKSRCSYCDFATDVWRSNDAVERYVDVLCREIQTVRCVPCVPWSDGVKPKITENTERRGNSKKIDTIYFGGGTPSLSSSLQIERILDTLNKHFDIATNTEITMEMNPATVTPETLAGYRSLGVNRASFGVQTFNDRDLKLLARGHSAYDARNTFKLLRDAGFDNVSFDLIIGLPGQTLDDWQRNLDEALAMQPEHLSLYLLEIHQGTPLAEQIKTNRRPVPEPELAAEMYELMQERVAAAGYAQYEISNFAKPGCESWHNTKYWRLDPVFGFGVSAHSFDGYQRYANERDTAQYVKRIEEFGGAEVMRESVNLASEYVFLGLRMTEGIDLSEYQQRFGTDLIENFERPLSELEDSGLVEVSNDGIRLTQKGMLYSNEVFNVFV